MAKASELDPRITDFSLDVEADRRMRQNLAEAGIRKPEDIASGRFDLGKVSDLLTDRSIDEEMNPLAAEKIMRDQDFARQASDEPAAAASLHTPAADEHEEGFAQPEGRLAELERQAQAALAETNKWKALYGRSENKVGEVRRKMAELESRLAPPQYVDARQLTGKSGEEVLTAQEVANLAMGLANAFGNQLRSVREELLTSAKTPVPESKISAVDEAELMDTHPWLESLPAAQRERAMLDMLATKPAAAVTATALSANKPAAPSEQFRAQVREAGFIEPSNRGSNAERMSATPKAQAVQAKLQKLRELLDKQGGSKEAEDLMAALGAGVVDDSEAGYLLRRR